MTAKQLWIIVVLGLAGLAASLAWQAREMGWLQLARVSNLPPDILRPLDTAGQQPPDLAAIRDLAPFGRQIQPDLPAKAEAGGPDPVRIDFLLRGVMAYQDPAISRAFISDGSATAAYRIDDRLDDSILLVDILPESVMLEIDGQRYELGFAGLIGGDTPVAAQEAPVAVAPDDKTDPLAQLAAAVRPGRGSLDLRDAPPPETVDEHIDMWRTRILRDPVEVMETIGVEPTERGYRVKSDPNIGVTLAGLRPGDIVTRLNGQQVGNVDNDRKLYDQVAAAGVARLEVERSGETLLMTFSLN